MSDDSRREFELNGKQLVFLFMAGTVAAVVIFLSGVMVGRGVQASRAAHEVLPAQLAPDLDATLADPTAAAEQAPLPAGVPVTVQETLTYAGRLEAPVPPPETLREPEPIAAPAVPRQTAAAVPITRSLREPAGSGWAVQVMAVPGTQRAEAEALAARLAAKGYPAYIVPRGARFAVRVGKFNSQHEAEAMSARLKKEEQFDPWVTR